MGQKLLPASSALQTLWAAPPALWGHLINTRVHARQSPHMGCEGVGVQHLSDPEDVLKEGGKGPDPQDPTVYSHPGTFKLEALESPWSWAPSLELGALITPLPTVTVANLEFKSWDPYPPNRDHWDTHDRNTSKLHCLNRKMADWKNWDPHLLRTAYNSSANCHLLKQTHKAAQGRCHCLSHT